MAYNLQHFYLLECGGVYCEDFRIMLRPWYVYVLLFLILLQQLLWLKLAAANLPENI